jgi:hypothetical protein
MKTMRCLNLINKKNEKKLFFGLKTLLHHGLQNSTIMDDLGPHSSGSEQVFSEGGRVASPRQTNRE